MSDAAAPISERLARIRDRHFDCYADLASAAEEAAGDRGEWVEILDSEIANIRSALAWGLVTSRRETAAFSASLLWYWRERRLYNEARHILGRALRGRDLLPLERTDALLAAGALAADQGHPEAARDHYEIARRLAVAAGDAARQARAAHGLGWSLYELSSTQGAVDAFTEARALSRSLSVAEAADVLRGLGWARVVNEGTEISLELHREARMLLEDAGDPALTEHYSVETNLLIGSGRVGEAMALANKSVEFARATGRPMSCALLAKSTAVRASGNRELLRQVLEEGIQVARSEGKPTIEADFHLQLAEDAMAAGVMDSARDALDRGRRLLDEIEVLDVTDADTRARLLVRRGDLADDEGELDFARELYRQAIAIYSRSSPQSHVAALIGLGQLHVGHGYGDAGRAAERQALAVSQRMDGEVDALQRIDLALLAGDVEGALRLTRDALEATPARRPTRIFWLLRRKADVLAELGPLDEAGATADELVAAGFGGGAVSSERARIRIALGDAAGARADLIQGASVAQVAWAKDQLQFATTLARLALLEGRRDTAVALWSAVQSYRAANKRLPPRLARRFEEPLTELGVAPESPTLDSRAALDELRRLVAEEFAALTAAEEPARP